ncbi:hypothetical protein GNI_184060 [Gregarina niphandrodes]|uniref:Uncharacterized protein n=1 Tax=Gregarina niphandrodes TaxID=110365 RepID=A0A023AY07_GRENI|nr:hypothetical protein GNI_184060 [Gregarina niphandrodes]EZG43175.1 hypothetical protein GNI_184060 [Gregarina niphandrodes]|eukprot:XP_011133569.1 hypothetical protein GNI_184060 [Gregarina niphandrodes]
MSKLAAFLKNKKKTGAKKPEVEETAAVAVVAAPASDAAAPAVSAKKEAWEDDVVDVEIVPVSVAKQENGSDFEDEEIDLPSSMVRGNFEWKRSEEEERKLAEKRKQAEAAAEAQKQASSRVFPLAKKNRNNYVLNDDDWLSLEDAAAKEKIAPVLEVKEKKTRTKKEKKVFVLGQSVANNEFRVLKCRDIWNVVEPWNASEYTWPTFASTS